MHFHNPVCIDLLASVTDIIFALHILILFLYYYKILYIYSNKCRYSYILDVILLILHAGIASTDLPVKDRLYKQFATKGWMTTTCAGSCGILLRLHGEYHLDIDSSGFGHF